VATQQLNINKIMWLAFGIALASFPHWQRLPLWIPMSHVGLLVARIYFPYKFPALWSQQKGTINIVRLLLMFAGVAGVYGSYGSLAGRDVGVALLVLLAGFKIFESNSKRDFYISTYLGYFLIITNFFYTQTIPTATYMMLVIIIMTAGLIDFNDTEQQLTLLKRFKLSTTLLIQAIPLLLVLFILFPRVNGPLWGLPKDAFTSTTGISDQMTPGSISKLVQSDEVAFRVTFKGDIPEQSTLYWRGPVLWQTDGRKWTMGSDKSDQVPTPIEFTGEPIHYDVTIEPSNKKWLFGLEMVSNLPDKTYFTNDYQLKTLEPIRVRQAFKLSSYTAFRINNNKYADIERGLLLPDTTHPKTRELASKLRDEYKDPLLIIEGALDWLKNKNFIYTLTPPLIAGDMVDEFLFNTRQGFCEHYAAAFTVLMRAAGIPARVVTGYQGGEVNPLGNYLIVRQREAHAWTEVWVENQGWMRIDPTSIISPTRVNEGINNAMPDAIIDIPLGLEGNKAAVRIWQRLRNTVDMVNYQWAQWVLGYGPARQKRFLQYLGFNAIDWKALTFYLFILLGIIVAAITAYIFSKTPKTNEPARKYYAIFCKKMAKAGLVRKSYEGPVDFAKRVSKTRKDLTKEIQNITNLYVLIRYCSNSNKNKLLQLKAAIKSFNPSKKILITN
jgi:protein-glutamine gamma-glutamyltransferase